MVTTSNTKIGLCVLVCACMFRSLRFFLFRLLPFFVCVCVCVRVVDGNSSSSIAFFVVEREGEVALEQKIQNPNLCNGKVIVEDDGQTSCFTGNR